MPIMFFSCGRLCSLPDEDLSVLSDSQYTGMSRDLTNVARVNSKLCSLRHKLANQLFTRATFIFTHVSFYMCVPIIKCMVLVLACSIIVQKQLCVRSEASQTYTVSTWLRTRIVHDPYRKMSLNTDDGTRPPVAKTC
jgi:hypothetical protein